MKEKIRLITFIIPCYNEEARLSASFSRIEDSLRAISPAGYIFVDDGSSDSTKETLERFRARMAVSFPGTTFETISYWPNRGKGWALYQGILACKTPWCLTMDADLSSGPEEVVKWLESGAVTLDDRCVYIGSRELGIREGLVEASGLRRMTGLVFNFLVRRFTGLPFSDTQCGYKLYPAAVARGAFEGLCDYGFAHDVEVLMRIRRAGISIVPLPLRWVEVSGSKVNLFKDSFRMLAAVIRASRRLNSRS